MGLSRHPAYRLLTISRWVDLLNSSLNRRVEWTRIRWSLQISATCRPFIFCNKRRNGCSNGVQNQVKADRKQQLLPSIRKRTPRFSRCCFGEDLLIVKHLSSNFFVKTLCLPLVFLFVYVYKSTSLLVKKLQWFSIIQPDKKISFRVCFSAFYFFN